MEQERKQEKTCLSRGHGSGNSSMRSSTIQFNSGRSKAPAAVVGRVVPTRGINYACSLIQPTIRSPDLLVKSKAAGEVTAHTFLGQNCHLTECTRFSCAPLIPRWDLPVKLHQQIRTPQLERKQIMEELLSLGEITWPLVITGLLLYSKSPVSMHFLGCLGDIELAGGSLAIGFANITGYSVMKGLSMGMEPICIQAFGAKKWNLLGQAFKKTVLLLLLTSVPIALLWFHMETILLWLGQDPDITSMASVYLTFCLPDLLAQAVLHPLRIFLRSQGLTRPLTLAAAIAFILHIPINYFLVIHHNLGVKGVALASAWTTLNINLILLAYLAFSDTALKPWVQSKEFNQRLQSWTLLAMATSSAVSVCLEWWWYEVMLILCGRLSTPSASVAAMGILIQTTGLIYVVPSSLSSGISTRVGHELGAGWPARAQWAAAVGLVVSAACGLMAFLFTTMVRDTWGKIFTADPQILSLVSMALPIVGFCELGNCPQTAGCGVLTGSARPKAAASINFSAFYVIGLPVAVLLSFGLKMGFLGLWFGLVAAQVSCMCMMAYVVARTDWKLQADRARLLTEAAGADDKINKLETGLLA